MQFTVGANEPELAEQHPQESKHQLKVSVDEILRRDCQILLLHAIFQQKLEGQMSVFDFVDLLTRVRLILFLKLLLAKEFNKIDDRCAVRETIFQIFDLKTDANG